MSIYLCSFTLNSLLTVKMVKTVIRQRVLIYVEENNKMKLVSSINADDEKERLASKSASK